MNDFVTDDEQVERIKKWWSDNGTSVVAGLVIGIGGLMGWRYFVDYKANVAAEASAHFATMISAIESNKNDQAIDEAFKILDGYSSTAYADLARLSLAKVYVEAAEFDKAEQQLQALVDSRPDTALEMLTRKRLSAVLLQQGKLDQSLEALDVAFPKEFAASFEELKGDILIAQGNTSGAREAYQRAKLAQPSAASPQFLQQKIDDLGQSGINS